MDASFEELWKHFKLSDEEKGVMTVESHVVAASKTQAQFSILFKLQTNRDFNKEAFKATCGNLWRGSQGVTIKEVGQNLFLAIFGSEEQLEVILNKRPWTFEKKLILMKRFSGDINPALVTFHSSPFWIRVFNIPIKSMTKEVGARIANEDRECHLLKTGCFSLDEGELQFGPWLRSLAPRVVHKKDEERSRKDVRYEDGADDIQSLAEEALEFPDHHNPAGPPSAVVDTSIQPVTDQRENSKLLERETELEHYPNPISISLKDKVVALPGSIIRSNSSEVTLDQNTIMSPSNSDVNRVVTIPDLTFERRDKDELCSALKHGVELYPDKVMLLDSYSNSTSSRVIRESAEQQFEIWEDREMELSEDKSVENIDLEKSSLRTWKRIMRNKKISNSENVSNRKLLSSKRFAVTRDPNTCTELHPHQKKLAIESTIDPFPLPITRGGSLPPLHSP
nr:hypothetical protein CFP56_66332 [Quercus suber]